MISVGIVGMGVIGRHVAEAIAAGIPGVALAGVNTLILVELTALKHGAVGFDGQGVVVTSVDPKNTSVGANPEPWVP